MGSSVTKAHQKTIRREYIPVSLKTSYYWQWSMADKGKDRKTVNSYRDEFLEEGRGKIKKRRTDKWENLRNNGHLTHTIVDYIRTKQLIWYRHVQRMQMTEYKKAGPEVVTAWKRRRGRPRRSWREGMNAEIMLRGLPNDPWVDRDQQQLGVGKCCRTL